MCFRTESIAAYEDTKKDLQPFAKMLGATKVNGREISTWRLHDPVYHGDWRIDLIELPAPKEGKPYERGLEHIELVLFDDIPKFLQKYSDKDFDMRAADRGINPEIGYKLDNYQVKFHLMSLSTVIYLEDKLEITEVADGM